MLRPGVKMVSDRQASAQIEGGGCMHVSKRDQQHTMFVSCGQIDLDIKAGRRYVHMHEVLDESIGSAVRTWCN